VATIAQLPDPCRAEASSMPEGPAVGRVEAEAESIDDVEHGASIERAMVERPKLRLSLRHFVQENRRPAQPDCRAIRRRKSGRTTVHVGGAFLLHN
jgi:hypothetical protein